MNIQIEDIDSCNKNVKVVIPHRKYADRVISYIDKVGQNAKVPGFRKGHIPRSMLEKRVGQEAKREVLTQLISETLMEALDEKGIRPAGLPSLLEVNGEEGADIEVSASVEVFPEFTVKDYSKIETPLKIKSTSDEEVDKVIEFYRTRAAKILPIQNRPVLDQDVVVIDFKGLADGKPFEGSEGKGKVLLVGGEGFLEDFDKQLIGMIIGESKSVSVDVPENYPKPDIAGKKVLFEVVLKSIQKRELPEVNDEFAKTADSEKNFESLVDMKAKIRQDLEVEHRKDGRKEAKQILARKLAEENPINVPDILVNNQIKHMVNQGRKQEGNTTGENQSPTQEEEEKFRENAVKLIQEELIILKLASDLKITIEEDELDRETIMFIQMLGSGADHTKMKRQWSQDGTLDRIRERMLRDKTLENLLGKVKIKEEIVDR
tara:strand:- start:197 stop:1495 length:1299 start_codon:yes stop_codon:yes gene_type:complete